MGLAKECLAGAGEFWQFVEMFEDLNDCVIEFISRKTADNPPAELTDLSIEDTFILFVC